MKRGTKAGGRIIALLTDFGLRDWFVASMKGVIKSIAPDAEIVDISHEVERHNIMSASFILEACYRDFPEGTIFCAVVDPGVGTERKRIAATDGTYFFIAPDNGLLTGVEAQSEIWLAYYITNPDVMHAGAGATFEGRDVFAPAAAYVAKGIHIESFGQLCEQIVQLDIPQPEKKDTSHIEGIVVYTDTFGNLITNITPGDIPATFDAANITVSIGRQKIRGIRASFAAVARGKLVAYWGSTGRLEIAINKGNAARELSAAPGTPITLRFGNPLNTK